MSNDFWKSLRDDNGESEPCSLPEIQHLDFSTMPTDVCLWLMGNDFPEVMITSSGAELHCEITEHIYSKFWWHKFSAGAFSSAMARAVTRLKEEGHPLSDPTIESDDDIHIFIRWNFHLPTNSSPDIIIESIRAAFNLVWSRADAILENSDSVLVLGKDTGSALDTLKRIAAKLESLGYYPYIIKEMPNRLGEGVIQKVLRYALSSKFVIIENSEPSGHLYEIPHVTKLAECVTGVLQEDGRGATWMFEDAYAKHKHWRKFTYATGDVEAATENVAHWCEGFLKEYAEYQKTHLPWM
ncbi:MAG: hypothetical protein ISS63_10815 [Desulfobacteraceae bacterium]|nr:hypothetical protein [Desulfobacteraceae bacterium]